MGSEAAAQTKLEDLSGIVLQPGENPYAAFIRACDDDHNVIRTLYDTHRTKRNAQQKAKFLSADYTGLSIDQHLLKLETDPAFRDERHCLVFWARPPSHIIDLAVHLQKLLRKSAPNVWLMPTYRMHMTTLELAFCKTPEEIADLVSTLRTSMVSVASYTHTHRTRLVRPTISYDLSAFALSFLPAAETDAVASPPPSAPDTAVDVVRNDAYSYHHLRRDIFDSVQRAGVEVGSRYQVPSAHITLGRYLTDEDHDTPDKRRAWVQAIDHVNAWLEKDVWDARDARFLGEWMVGQERGLDMRAGTLWYGAGRTITMGEGF
ncbi:Ureidoglycolate hydrolase [Geosmithia morbida]|uniref:Ureidoglycolate hydrolase n=1 Tax=Geosmithia morbida TaxID=1094350 RepID=A0A9P5D330_9HYPO|nr:Ureidoglycolate hydrolase [Geosmithia morbida]KAF4125748.1 Ureidoglycolate hydrolase [Geosmithia morbida]